MLTRFAEGDFFGPWFLQCCNSQVEDLKVVHLSSDVLECHPAQPVHLLTQQDPFDMLLTPRVGFKSDAPAPQSKFATPRQRSLRERIWLPQLRRYPIPPNCTADDPEDVRRDELLAAYQDFVMDLHKGIHLTQLNSNQDYSEIHCQILEDLQTLKVDQGNGSIIEFPLGAVSKVYRIIKNDGKWYSTGSSMGPSPMPPLPLSNAEHIVVIEFMRRKLPFVFSDIKAAQRFLMFIELLIRRAQEGRREAEAPRPPRSAASSDRLRSSPGPSGFGPHFQPREPGERFARPILSLSATELKSENGETAPSSASEQHACTCQSPL